jgi:hypothetical protein
MAYQRNGQLNIGGGVLAWRRRNERRLNLKMFNRRLWRNRRK